MSNTARVSLLYVHLMYRRFMFGEQCWNMTERNDHLNMCEQVRTLEKSQGGG
jgi:hypothetical protein